MTVNSKIFSNLQEINPSAIIELFTLQLSASLHYDYWEASNSYEVGDILGHTTANKLIVFKCTVAGQSGTTEPSAFATASAGQTVTDNQVTWTAQSVDIERFHAGSNLNANGQLVWAGNSYQRFPVQASGFAFQRGQLPRPKLVVSNATGLISAILLRVNKSTTGNDLTGATVTRIRTLAKFIDAINFSDGTNATADPNAEFPQEIYKVDRKSAETREVVEFELAAPTDLAGVRIPGRQATRSIFPAIGTFLA
tara:strand:+ start:1155 stop:1913 length:759 start_codon:yes stop_codon:yes gene_type:complete